MRKDLRALRHLEDRADHPSGAVATESARIFSKITQDPRYGVVDRCASQRGTVDTRENRLLGYYDSNPLN